MIVNKISLKSEPEKSNTKLSKIIIHIKFDRKEMLIQKMVPILAQKILVTFMKNQSLLHVIKSKNYMKLTRICFKKKKERHTTNESLCNNIIIYIYCKIGI